MVCSFKTIQRLLLDLKLLRNVGVLLRFSFLLLLFAYLAYQLHLHLLLMRE